MDMGPQMTCVWLLEKCNGLLLSPPTDIGWLSRREVQLCCEGFPEEGTVGIVQDAVEHCIPCPKNSIAFPALCENNALRKMQCQMGIVLLKLQFLLAAVGGLILPKKVSVNNGLTFKKSSPPKTTGEDLKLGLVSW